MIRSTFVSHFEKWLNLTQVKNFTCFFKDNSIIVRLFEIFFIPLSVIRCISYQEMKIIAQHHRFSPSLYVMALSTLRLAQSTRVFSNDFR